MKKLTGVRLRENQVRVAHQVEQELGLSLSDQLRKAYDFFTAAVFPLAVETMSEEQAIALLRETAKALRERYYQRKRVLPQVLREAFREV